MLTALKSALLRVTGTGEPRYCHVSCGRVRVLRAEVAAVAESHEELLVYARAWKRSAEHQQELRREIEEIVEERDALSAEVAALSAEVAALELAALSAENRLQQERGVHHLPKQDSDSYW